MEQTEGMEQIRKEQLELREKVLQLRENELLQLRQQVIRLEGTLKMLVTIVTVFATLATFFGLNTYFRELDKKVDEVVSAAMKGHVENAKKRWNEQVSAHLAEMRSSAQARAFAVTDDLYEVTFVLQDEISRFHSTRDTDGLAALAMKWKENEYLFGIYTDALIRKGEYQSASQYLDALKAQGIFPQKFGRPGSYLNAGVILWWSSLTEPSPKLEGARMREASVLLERALDLAKEAQSKRLTSMSMEHLILFRLYEGRHAQAAQLAKQFKDLGGSKDVLNSCKTRRWFKGSMNRRPSFPGDLEELTASVFPEGKPATAPK